MPPLPPPKKASDTTTIDQILSPNASSCFNIQSTLSQHISGIQHGRLAQNIKSLKQVAVDGQRQTFAAIVQILEQPQRMSFEDRQSLTSSLAHRSFLSISSDSSVESPSARDSIFAKPREQLEARLTIARPHQRSSSAHATSPIIGKGSFAEDALKMPSPTDYTTKMRRFDELNLFTPPNRAPEIQFRNPFQQRPQRASTLAPIPITELEIDPLFVQRTKSQYQSPISDSPLIDFPLPKRNRPVGFPFLPQQATTPNFQQAVPPHPVVITTSPVELPAVLPSWLSSPLSDGPMPELPAASDPPLSKTNEQQGTTLTQQNVQQHTLRSRATTLGREESLTEFSPFSEPSYESSGSYFSIGSAESQTIPQMPKTRSPSKSITSTPVTKKPVSHSKIPQFPEDWATVPPLRSKTPPVKKQTPASSPSRSAHFPASPKHSPRFLSSIRDHNVRSERSPPISPSPPRSPRKHQVSTIPSPRLLPSFSESNASKVQAPPALESSSVIGPVPKRPLLPRSTSETATERQPPLLTELPRVSTDSAPPRPSFLTALSRPSTESIGARGATPSMFRPSIESSSVRPSTASTPVRQQLVAAPPAIIDTKLQRSPRELALEMGSPDDVEQSLVQPSAWNEYLGFCVGAALAQMDTPGAMIQSRTVQADIVSHSVINFLKCSHNKCAFQGHGPKDKIWEVNGVLFRRDFLVKSHCKQKKARNSIYTYQCIFCTLMRQRSPVFQGQDSFISHVSTHRDQPISEAILKRTKCIAGRRAGAEEVFDINLLPLLPSSPQPLQPARMTQSSNIPKVSSYELDSERAETEPFNITPDETDNTRHFQRPNLATNIFEARPQFQTFNVNSPARALHSNPVL